MTTIPDLPQAALDTIDPEDFGVQVWERLKRFVQFDEDDVRRLTGLFEPHAGLIDQVVDRFYDHLLSFAETRRILASHDVAGRLKESQRHYLRGLCSGDYGEEYLRDRLRVGLAHERAGLALRWYLGGYWLYMRELVPVLLEGVDEKRVGTVTSFLKVLILDMQLISESYVGRTMALVRAQNRRLEEIVNERTRQLTKWERLAAVGSMSAKVAHEIRNPLSSITLNAELLDDELAGLNEGETQEARQLLDSISGEIERLSRIVEEYLQFARLPRLELNPVDLVELVGGVVDFLEPEFSGQGIATQVEADPDLPRVALDRDQFRQVLLNLLRNAEEAMPDGGQVRLEVRLCPDEGGIRLTVQDTGGGIDPADADKLFDPFYTTKDTGTGLGLPFVQQVVQEHHAEIRAEGEPGRGARFEILIPEKLMMRAWRD